MHNLKETLRNQNFLLHAAWVISILATLSSLALSEVFDLIPCLLCWWQRIFMYPLPIIIGIGIWRRLGKETAYLALPFTILGGLFAAYHYYLQYFLGPNSTACTGGISCTTKQIEVLGFMTIPFGAFWCFAAIAVLMWLLLRVPQSSKEVKAQ